MGIVQFDYKDWASSYPQIAESVPAPMAREYFNIATISYINNTEYSIISDLSERKTLIYLLMNHISVLFSPQKNGGNGGSVGRAASASRGSVSVSFDLPPYGDGAFQNWLYQTQWGMMFYAATARYRVGRFIGGRRIKRGSWP